MPPTPLIKMVLKLGLSSSFDPAAAADALRVKRDFDAQIKELLAGLSLAGLRYLVINNMPAPPRSAPAPGVTPATARHHRGPEPVAAVGAPAGLGRWLALAKSPPPPALQETATSPAGHHWRWILPSSGAGTWRTGVAASGSSTAGGLVAYTRANCSGESRRSRGSCRFGNGSESDVTGKDAASAGVVSPVTVGASDISPDAVTFNFK